MENEFGLPANSNRAKARANVDPEGKPEKKVERIVKSEVITRKTPLGRRFVNLFVGGDRQGVLNYLLVDVFVPAAQAMVTDLVSQGVERAVYGEVRSSSQRATHRGGMNNGRVSYSRFSNGQSYGNASRDPRTQPPGMSQRGRATHDFNEIILATRVEANEVVDQMLEIVENYGVVTVADLYASVGIDGNFTDAKWGWADLRGAGVTHVKNGYLLDLPAPEPVE